MRLFDVDLPHPHHFLPGDVVSLFEGHTLVLQDLGVMSQIDSAFPSRGKCPHVKLYRLDKFGRRMARDLRLWGKSPVGVFAAKYFLCYGLALCTAAARRREKLAHPLKKARLFVFQKQA
jgi:hypothetical protein